VIWYLFLIYDSISHIFLHSYISASSSGARVTSSSRGMGAGGIVNAITALNIPVQDYTPVLPTRVTMRRSIPLTNGGSTRTLTFHPGQSALELQGSVFAVLVPGSIAAIKQHHIGRLDNLFGPGGICATLGQDVYMRFGGLFQNAQLGEEHTIGMLLCAARSGISAALTGYYPPGVDPTDSPTYTIAKLIERKLSEMGINFTWLNARMPNCTCHGCIAINDEEAGKMAPLIQLAAEFFQAIGGGLRFFGAAGTSRGIDKIVSRLDPTKFMACVPIANHLSLVTYPRPAGNRKTFAIRSADMSVCYFNLFQYIGHRELFQVLVDDLRCVMISDNFSNFGVFDFQGSTLPQSVTANSSQLASNFVTCVSNASEFGRRVMDGRELLDDDMCAEEAATSCGWKVAEPVIVFWSATVMSILGLTSKDDILNQSPQMICASVPALNVCSSKDSVVSTFGGGVNNLTNVTLGSGPVLHRERAAITLVRYNPSGIGGPQYRTPLMSDINTNGNELVSMGSSLVTHIEAVMYCIENDTTLLVYDALDGTSLISIQTSRPEQDAFFPGLLRRDFTLNQVHDSMPGGLQVGDADNLWLVKVLTVGQHIDDFTIAVDADARIAVINNRYHELLQANAPDDSHYGKDCIVSENGEDIAKFSSLNLAKGKTKCDNYAQYGVGATCIVPGQSRVQQYTLPRLRAATDSRGLRSSKYPTRFLRLCRVGEFDSSNAPNPCPKNSNGFFN